MGDLDRCGCTARLIERRHCEGDNTAVVRNLVWPPLLVVLDLPVVAPDHTEQIFYGPLTFKDRMAYRLYLSPVSIHGSVPPAPTGGGVDECSGQLDVRFVGCDSGGGHADLASSPGTRN